MSAAARLKAGLLVGTDYEVVRPQRPALPDAFVEIEDAARVKPARGINEVNPGLPAPLVKLVMYMLAKALKQRPAHAGEVVKQLIAFRDGTKETRKDSKRTALLAAGAAVAGIATVVELFGMTASRQAVEPRTAVAAATPMAAASTPSTTPSLSAAAAATGGRPQFEAAFDRGQLSVENKSSGRVTLTNIVLTGAGSARYTAQEISDKLAPGEVALVSADQFLPTLPNNFRPTRAEIGQQGKPSEAIDLTVH